MIAQPKTGGCKLYRVIAPYFQWVGAMRVSTKGLGGLGLAILGWVGPMIWPTFPQWVVQVLFSGGVVLIVQSLVAPYLLKGIKDKNLKKFVNVWMAVVFFASTYSAILLNEQEKLDKYRITKAHEINLLRQKAFELARELRQFETRMKQEDSGLMEVYRQRNLAAKTNSERAKNQKDLRKDSSDMYWRHEDEFEPLLHRAIDIRKATIAMLPPEKALVLSASEDLGEEALRGGMFLAAPRAKNVADLVDRLAHALYEN